MIYCDEILMMILFTASEYISDVGLHNLGDIVLNDVLLCPKWFFTKHVFTCIMCAGRLFVVCRCTIGLFFKYDLLFCFLFWRILVLYLLEFSAGLFSSYGSLVIR